MNDEAIAWRLAQSNLSKITREMVLVWQRHRDGESLASMERDYPNFMRSGEFFHERTLYRWVAKVDQAIETDRLIERESRVWDQRGHTVASGSRTRRAGDPTQGRRVVIDQSSWDEDTMKKYGVLDRWSRKYPTVVHKSTQKLQKV